MRRRTALPGGVDQRGYQVGWLRSQARVQPPHPPLASGLGTLLLSLPAYSGSIHLCKGYICSLSPSDRMEEQSVCKPMVGNSTRSSPLVSMPPCGRYPPRTTLPSRRRTGFPPLERNVFRGSLRDTRTGSTAVIEALVIAALHALEAHVWDVKKRVAILQERGEAVAESPAVTVEHQGTPPGNHNASLG